MKGRWKRREKVGGIDDGSNQIEGGDLENPTHFAQGEAQPFCVRVPVRCLV